MWWVSMSVCREDAIRHTFTIFKLFLDHWIIDIGQDLISLQLLLHTIHSDLLPNRASTFGIIHCHDLCDLDAHILNLFDLFCTVGSQNLSRILEALIW